MLTQREHAETMQRCSDLDEIQYVQTSDSYVNY